jgi:GNAT superfamily N-acetyltransferase
MVVPVQDIKIRKARYDEPAVVALLIDVMAELAGRYGGSGDDTPVDPADFLPPRGAFFVASVDLGAVDLGAVDLGAVDLGAVDLADADLAAVDLAAVDLAAVAGERLVGCAGWRRHGDDAELKRMFTATAARGRGLGRRMLATIEESAREAGYKRVILETGDRQPEAVRLYESAGYVRIDDFGYYAGMDGVLSFGKVL